MKNLRQLLSWINLRKQFKYLFQKFAPYGTWRHEFTHNIIWGYLKQFRPMNIRYQHWIKQFDHFTNKHLDQYRKNVSTMSTNPKISVIMPVFNPEISFLNQAIQSVRDQVYPHWELCIADDASTNPGVRELIKKHVDEDPRIRAVFRKKNGHISAASNSALKLATGDFIALLDHDDKLHPLGLYFVAEEINKFPESIVIYSDEDKLTRSGKRIDPYFKSDFDYELLLGQNMVSHLGVYKTAKVRQVGGFRIGLEGSQDYDLLLRVIQKIRFNQIRHIPIVLYHWRISKQSVATDIEVKPYALNAGALALNEHLRNRNITASVEVFHNFGYKIHYHIPKTNPLLEIFIIPKSFSKITENYLNMFSDRTGYENYKITLIMPDNKISQELSQTFKNHKIISFEPDLLNSTSYIIEKLNTSIRNSCSDYIGVIDENLIRTSKDWLADILSTVIQPDIGVVSPKLLYDNGFTYSNGLILGKDQIAKHIFNGVNSSVINYYFGWSSLYKGYSALPAGCILVSRQHYETVGGFNQSLTGKTARMIDFCLKLKEQGLRNILVPDASVTLSRSKRFFNSESDQELVQNEADREYLLAHWGHWIQDDPAFNPNLTIHKGKPMVSKNPRFMRPENISAE